MNITVNGQRYVIQWEYIDDPNETERFILSYRPPASDFVSQKTKTGKPVKRYTGHVPLKFRHVGMAVCRIKVPASDAYKAEHPNQTLQVLYTGYSFCHNSDKFDKRKARKNSLRHAMEGNLPDRTRHDIWTEFNSLWPPVRPEEELWKRKYVAAAMENAKLAMMVNQMEAVIRGRQAAGAPDGASRMP